jgi:hypothetical protein
VHPSAAYTAEQLLISICNFSLCKKRETRSINATNVSQHLGVHPCDTNKFNASRSLIAGASVNVNYCDEGVAMFLKIDLITEEAVCLLRRRLLTRGRAAC